MLMLEYVKWWYGRGWIEAAERAQKRLLALSDLFSITILLRTLFAPWKRIITYPGAGLEAYMRAMLDNLVSRVIGFFVRVIVLIAAAISFVAVALLSGLQILAWLFVPPAALALIAWGLL